MVWGLWPLAAAGKKYVSGCMQRSKVLHVEGYLSHLPRDGNDEESTRLGTVQQQEAFSNNNEQVYVV